METENQIAIVTNDKWMRLPGGVLDPDDKALIRETSQNGKLSYTVMNWDQMVDAMMAEDPDKLKEFKTAIDRQAGETLTWEKFLEYGRRADSRKTEIDVFVARVMTPAIAKSVRHWRIDEHRTWRAVARAAHDRWLTYIVGKPAWKPVSNQLVGMALCERAAIILGDDPFTDPWF